MSHDSWYVLRQQPGLYRQNLFHAIVVGQVISFPALGFASEGDIHLEQERELLRQEQKQFLQTMTVLDNRDGDMAPSLDLRVGIRPGSNQHCFVGVVARATSNNCEEADGFARQLWQRLSTTFPSRYYGFVPPPDHDPTFLSTILPSEQALHQTRIWEITKQAYVMRYGQRIVETVGTFNETLDSMINSWRALVESKEQLLLSIRCSPFKMSDQLRTELDFLYHFMVRGDYPILAGTQEAPLIEDAKRRLENLLSSMYLAHLRIQLVSWGSDPIAIKAAIKASLTAAPDANYRSCECEWQECLQSEYLRARDELLHIYIDEDVPSTERTFVQQSHSLVTIDELSAIWRLPLARRHSIPGITFARNPFTISPPMTPSNVGIMLGNVIGANSNRRPFVVPVDNFSKHVLILGEPGSGKSTTTQSLIYQLWRDGKASMVIDPVSTEYRDLWLLSSRFREGPKSMLVFSPGAQGDVGTLLAFNPFCPQPQTSLDTHILALKDCFGSALALPDSWRELIGRAIRNAYQNLGWPSWDPVRNREEISAIQIDENVFPTFIDLIKATQEEIARFRSGEFRINTEAGLLGRLHDFAAGPVGALIHTRKPLNIAALVQRPTVIELRAIRDTNAKSLVMLFLLTQLQQHYAHFSRVEGLRHVVIIEEAHRLLSPSNTQAEGESNARAKAIDYVVEMLAEQRKYGAGMVLVEQLPSRLDSNVVKLPSIKILHRLPAQYDREMVANAMNMNQEQTRYVATLRPGEATVYTDQLDESLLLHMSNPWQSEPTPAGQRTKPTNSQQQRQLEQEVETHTQQAWQQVTKKAPFNPCTLCLCGCRPRLRLLESGNRWWRIIEVGDIIIQFQAAMTEQQKVSLVGELLNRVKAANANALEDDQLCAITLLMEHHMQGIAQSVHQGRRVQQMEAAIEAFLRYFYHQP